MFSIKTYNNISEKGLQRFPAQTYRLGEDVERPDAIMLRSFDLHSVEIPPSVQAVGRAGAGVNNIPVAEMSMRGVPVFNAPGANANAVKELVLAGMLLACRNICQAWQYTLQLEGSDEEMHKAVEAGKKKFVGFELPGRVLGVIGLGAIGVQVANAAVALGMKVVGYDPTITVKRAWQLSSDVQEMGTVEDLLQIADFVTFHVPLLDQTRHLLNAKRLAGTKDGIVVLNFARDGIVDERAILDGIQSGKVNAYVCDFPSRSLRNNPRVITLPHLGASTVEAEENCAIMVADQLKEFLENGNIKNSVNFPDLKLRRAGEQRLAIANLNRPDMVGQISHFLGKADANILRMANESRGELAYNLIDLDGHADESTLNLIRRIDGVLSVRAI